MKCALAMVAIRFGPVAGLAEQVVLVPQSVVLLGGRQASADRLLQMWPMLGQAPKRGVLLPEVGPLAC